MMTYLIFLCLNMYRITYFIKLILTKDFYSISTQISDCAYSDKLVKAFNLYSNTFLLHINIHID